MCVCVFFFRFFPLFFSLSDTMTEKTERDQKSNTDMWQVAATRGEQDVQHTHITNAHTHNAHEIAGHHMAIAPPRLILHRGMRAPVRVSILKVKYYNDIYDIFCISYPYNNRIHTIEYVLVFLIFKLTSMEFFSE